MTIEEHTRRRFLAALGATGAAAALAPGAAGAAPPPPDAGSGEIVVGQVPGTSARPELSPVGRGEAFPAPTAGLRYTLVSAGHCFPMSSGFPYSKSMFLISNASSSFGLPLDMLPNGAVIAEITCSLFKAPTFPGNISATLHRFTPYDPAAPPVPLVTANTNALPSSTAVQYLTLPLAGAVGPRTIDRSAAEHWLVFILGDNILFEVRIGWLPPPAPLGFYPIAPKRVYDSRRPTAGGALNAGGSRVVSVKDGYVNDSDTLDAPNVIPVGAKAIAYNLTVTGTTGAGFLSVGPGDAAGAAGSAINWSGPNLSLANGLTVTLDASRQIKVFAGPGGGAQFLIDAMGYYA